MRCKLKRKKEKWFSVYIIYVYIAKEQCRVICWNVSCSVLGPVMWMKSFKVLVFVFLCVGTKLTKILLPRSIRNGWQTRSSSCRHHIPNHVFDFCAHKKLLSVVRSLLSFFYHKYWMFSSFSWIDNNCSALDWTNICTSYASDSFN